MSNWSSLHEDIQLELWFPVDFRALILLGPHFLNLFTDVLQNWQKHLTVM